jgi:RNA polymerase sigma-B factor
MSLVGTTSETADGRGDAWQGPSEALLMRARSGDAQACDRIMRELMPVAERVARRFASASHPAEDLAQVASIGLLKAIDRFDPAHETAFTTYAHALMTGEIRRHVRDSRMVRIPRSIYEQVPRFQRTFDDLRRQLGRAPSRQEIALAMGLSKEEVIEIADAAVNAQHVSLDTGLEDGSGETQFGAGEDRGFEQAEAGADLVPMLRALSPRERMIINLRFGEGLSQAEIATGMGLSQTQVSRLIRQALAKLSARAGAPVS